MVAQEVINSMKRRKNKSSGVANKLDLEKAYNTLTWSFIGKNLKAFNFPSKWIRLIMSYITSYYLLVLFNGGITNSSNPTNE